MLTIYSRAILLPCNNYLQCLTLDKIPQGPLAHRVRQVRSLPLSQFQRFNKCHQTCVYLIEGHGCHEWLGPTDLPELLQWMLQNDYVIQSQLTKILISQMTDVVGSFEYIDRYYRPLEQDEHLQEKNKALEKRRTNTPAAVPPWWSQR